MCITGKAPTLLVLRIEKDVFVQAYRAGTVLQRDRWGDMRTSGPVAKTLFEGRMAFFLAEAVGDWVEFDVTPPQPGTFEVWMSFCKFQDRAKFRVLLDGQVINESLDLYAPEIEWTPPIQAGTRPLTGVFAHRPAGPAGLNAGPAGLPMRKNIAGRHALRFEVTGKAEASSGFRLGLESVALIPLQPAGTEATPTFQVTEAGLRIDWGRAGRQMTGMWLIPARQGLAIIGDVTTDADACALVRQGEKIVYWQMQNGSSLSVSGAPLAPGLPARRDVCSEH